MPEAVAAGEAPNPTHNGSQASDVTEASAHPRHCGDHHVGQEEERGWQRRDGTRGLAAYGGSLVLSLPPRVLDVSVKDFSLAV